MKSIKFFVIISILFVAFSCNKKDSSTKQSADDANKEKTFQKVDVKQLQDNAVSLFADNWFVVSAGNDSAFNQMTVSWGALGYVWQQPSITIYIRHTRHTFPFIDNGKYFTLCSFDEEYRDKVQFIGSHSGRDTDKMKETGLTPKFTELGNPYYEEARLVIECEKMYYNDIARENILIEEGQKMYEKETAPHRMFIGKIVNVWEKK